jgi:hypothetical protein
MVGGGGGTVGLELSTLLICLAVVGGAIVVITASLAGELVKPATDDDATPRDEPAESASPVREGDEPDEAPVDEAPVDEAGTSTRPARTRRRRERGPRHFRRPRQPAPPATAPGPAPPVVTRRSVVTEPAPPAPVVGMGPAEELRPSAGQRVRSGLALSALVAVLGTAAAVVVGIGVLALVLALRNAVG